jgi:hypothetical protein
MPRKSARSNCGPCTNELIDNLRAMTDQNYAMFAQSLMGYSPAGMIEGQRILDGFIEEHGPKRRSVYYG